MAVVGVWASFGSGPRDFDGDITIELGNRYRVLACTYLSQVIGGSSATTYVKGYHAWQQNAPALWLPLKEKNPVLIADNVVSVTFTIETSGLEGAMCVS